jgi:hypothetical protein
MNGFSFGGRSSRRERKAMGLGVWVRVASPMWCRAAMNRPQAIPTLSFG